MTPASIVLSTLTDLYLNRTIADHMGARFTVRCVQISTDCGEMQVCFWSHPTWFPNPPPPGLRGFLIRQNDELPTIL